MAGLLAIFADNAERGIMQGPVIGRLVQPSLQGYSTLHDITGSKAGSNSVVAVSSPCFFSLFLLP
jgi:hypothetical protein